MRRAGKPPCLTGATRQHQAELMPLLGRNGKSQIKKSLYMSFSSLSHGLTSLITYLSPKSFLSHNHNGISFEKPYCLRLEGAHKLRPKQQDGANFSHRPACQANVNTQCPPWSHIPSAGTSLLPKSTSRRRGLGLLAPGHTPGCHRRSSGWELAQPRQDFTPRA